MELVVWGVLAALTVLCVPVLCQDEPEIAKQILPEIKRKGMTGYLNCTVTRQGISKVFWSHKERGLELTQDDQITVGDRFNQVVNGYPKYEIFRIAEGDGWTYQLVTHRLSEIDIGTYICKIQVIGTGNNKEKEGKMLVLVPPDIQPGETTHTLSIEEGGRANLTCHALGYPQPNITWVRPNGKSVPGHGFSYKGSTLILDNLREDDRGVYRCVADNNVRPPAVYDSTLYVEFQPTTRPVQATYGQATNKQYDLTIECIVSGYPAPDLRWYKVTMGGGFDPIIDDDWHDINTLLSHGNFLSISDVWYQLTIRNVRAGDLGDYKCEGINKYGRRLGNIRVYETDLCQGANCPQLTDDTGSASTLTTSLTLLLTALIVTRQTLL